MKGETKTMATKRTVKKASDKSPAKTTTAVKKQPTKRNSTSVTKSLPELSGEQLVVENLATLSSLVRTISETLDVLVQKTENMAYHLIATEEILAEVVSTTGIDLATVNKKIRTKIAIGTEKKGDPTKAIDIAASIASPTAKPRN